MVKETTAPEGAIWVCGVCGKTSPDRWGHTRATQGWDTSCASNAILCEEVSLLRDSNGRVAKAEERCA